MVQEFESERKAGEDILRKVNYVLTYDILGNLITIVETDIISGVTRTSTLTYDVVGNLITIVQV